MYIFICITCIFPSTVLGVCLDITCMFSGTLLGVGVSCLEKVNLKCSRTIVTLGFSLVLGMSVSQYIAKNPHAINTGRYRKQNYHVIHTCDAILQK